SDMASLREGCRVSGVGCRHARNPIALLCETCTEECFTTPDTRYPAFSLLEQLLVQEFDGTLDFAFRHQKGDGHLGVGDLIDHNTRVCQNLISTEQNTWNPAMVGRDKRDGRTV